jgi:hypothetical protein
LPAISASPPARPISDDRDRRLTMEVRDRTREWIASAEQVMALVAGDRNAAVTQ